jgi:hypothetical protein
MTDGDGQTVHDGLSTGSVISYTSTGAPASSFRQV